MHHDQYLFLKQRRLLLSGMAVSPLILSSTIVDARLLRYLRLVLRLHVARFIGGLIFDAASAVVINYWDRGSDGSYSYHNSLAFNESDFSHSRYAGAVIDIGLSDADFEKYLSRPAISLKSDADYGRFEVIHRYLIDNRVRIAMSGSNASRKIQSGMDADDLFNIDYLVFNSKSNEYHYTALLEQTEVTAFDEWVI